MNILAEAIIVYRSRGEEMRDEFWYDTAIPFIVDHFLICATVTGVLFLFFLWWASPRR